MTANPSLQKKYQRRVLVVDDAEFYRVMLKDLLEQQGHEVQAAEDGVQALATLAEWGTPHMMLLDLNMPNLDGFGVLQKVRGEFAEVYESMMIMVITGEDIPVPSLREMRDYNITGFISKTDPPEFTLNRILKALF